MEMHGAKKDVQLLKSSGNLGGVAYNSATCIHLRTTLAPPQRTSCLTCEALRPASTSSVQPLCLWHYVLDLVSGTNFSALDLDMQLFSLKLGIIVLR